jgi:hypothetical protein
MVTNPKRPLRLTVAEGCLLADMGHPGQRAHWLLCAFYDNSWLRKNTARAVARMNQREIAQAQSVPSNNAMRVAAKLDKQVLTHPRGADLVQYAG